MKIKKILLIVSVLFTCLNLYAEVLFSFYISSYNEMDSFLSKSNDKSLAAKYLKLILDLEVKAILGKSKEFIDLDKPIYGVLQSFSDNPLTLKTVILINSNNPKKFIESLPSPFLGKNLKTITAFSKDFNALNSIDSFNNYIIDEYKNKKNGIFIRSYVDNSWKVFKSSVQILRGVWTLMISNSPSLQRQFNQFLEIIFLMIDSLKDFTINLQFSDTSSNEEFVFDFNFKEKHIFKGLFPKVSFNTDLQSKSELYSSLRFAYNPMKMRDFLIKFIGILQSGFLSDTYEFEKMKQKVYNLFGSDLVEGLHIIDCFSYSLDDGSLQSVIRIEKENKKIDLIKVEEILKELFSKGPYKCLSSINPHDKFKNILIVDLKLKELTEIDGELPVYLKTILYIISGLETNIHFEFIEEHGIIKGIFGSFDNTIIQKMKKNNKILENPFLEFKLKPSYVFGLFDLFKDNKKGTLEKVLDKSKQEKVKMTMQCFNSKQGLRMKFKIPPIEFENIIKNKSAESKTEEA